MYTAATLLKTLSLTMLCAATFGCASQSSAPKTAVDETSLDDKSVDADSDVEKEFQTIAASSADVRQPGDYVVFKFSGNFTNAPMTLTEKVVRRDGDRVALDLTLQKGDSTETLRVWMQDGGSTDGAIISVSELSAGVENAVPVKAYDELMNRVVVTADENEELLETKDLMIKVSGQTIACVENTFRVRVGNRDATLKTVSSDGFLWGDIGGEIATASGAIYYKAELVELGHEAAAPVASLK